MEELNPDFFINTVTLLISISIAVSIEIHVNIGDSLTINCSSATNTTGNHIWWFNDKILFADIFTPKDIGVENICGEFQNGTSYLHFTQLATTNSGNYSCFVGNTETSFYILSISVSHQPRVSAYLLCMYEECPTILLLNASVEYEFQCYTDTVLPTNSFHWKINDVLATMGTEDQTFNIGPSGENVTKFGSSLRILPRIEDENVTCNYENISRIVFTHVVTEKMFDRYIAFVALPGGSVAIVLFFIIIITVGVLRHRYSKPDRAAPPLQAIFENYDENVVTEEDAYNFYGNYEDSKPDRVAPPLQDISENYDENVVTEEDAYSFYGNYEDYEDFETYYEVQEMAFYNHQISRNNEIDIFLKGSCWEGILKRRDQREEERVLISCATAGVTLEEKYFLEKQIGTKLKLAGHENILRTLGYYQEEGITYLIQDYSDVMPLVFFLVSDYSNLGEIQSEFTSMSYFKYCCDVISGMSYLSQENCCHPGLSVQKVLISQGETCKLHDFCLLNDGQRVLELFIKQDEDSCFRLAPENLTTGEYTFASDVWAAGITMWEILSGGILASSRSKKDDTLRLPTGHFLLSQPNGCPAQIYGMMKLCWCTRCDDRPSFEDIKLVLEDARMFMKAPN